MNEYWAQQLKCLWN